MNKNSFYLEKFSQPQNNPLFVAMQVAKSVRAEVHVNDLVERVQRKRKSVGTIEDEARVLQGIGFLITMGKLGYYKGMIFNRKKS